jgi:hypothetical protein
VVSVGLEARVDFAVQVDLVGLVDPQENHVLEVNLADH